MECCICYGKRYFSGKKSCQANHFFHKKCLNDCLQNSTLYPIISDCKACIETLLPNIKKKNKILYKM